MKIWLLTPKSGHKKYHTLRFKEEAKRLGIKLKVVSPEEFDILEPIVPGKVAYRNRIINVPDCVITRYGSATGYFDLAVIRHFEQLGVFVFNSAVAIEKARDKFRSIQLLAKVNIPIPKTMLAKFPLNTKLVDQEFQYPVILKLTTGSLGKGVLLCENSNQLEDIVDLTEYSLKTNVILQEFISTSKGKDIRVFVIGGRAIGAMLRTAQQGKFKANFSAGSSVSNFELTPEIEWLAVESAKLLGLEVAGVDILFDKEGYKICEVNASPMFQGFEAATKINIPEEIFKFIQVRLEGGISLM